MRNELEAMISEEMNKVDPTLGEIYSKDTQENIEQLVKEQNQKVQDSEEYRQDLLKVVKRLKELDLDIEIREEMSVQELEEIIDNVKF